VSIRVNLKGDGWSVNIVKWNFFVNTKPAKCVAYGPGLFDSDNAGWGFPAVFKVQAKDTAGRNRSSGGEAANWRPRVVLKETGESVPCRVEDCGDGTYDMIYVPHRPGAYIVEVGYNDPLLNGTDVVPIRGSPWTASFDDPWSKARPTGEPPLAVPGAAVCGVMKKMVMYGGGDGVVSFDPDSMAWEKLDVDGAPPPPRTQHSMTALDGEKAVVCGGWSEERQARLNDVVLLVCDKGKWRWQEAGEVQGDKLPPRSKHAACLNTGKRVVVFGGVGGDEKKLDDLMVLSAANPAKMEWLAIAKRVAPDTDPDPDDAPPPAPAEPEPAAPAAAAGGEGHGEEEEGDEEEHKKGGEEAEAVRVIPVLKEVPGRRCDHGLAAVEGVVYAFGGAADVENESVLTAVTVVGEFELEGKTLSRGDGIRWRRLRVTGDVPCARSDFVMTSLDGKVVVQVRRAAEHPACRLAKVVVIMCVWRSAFAQGEALAQTLQRPAPDSRCCDCGGVGGQGHGWVTVCGPGGQGHGREPAGRHVQPGPRDGRVDHHVPQRQRLAEERPRRQLPGRQAPHCGLGKAGGQQARRAAHPRVRQDCGAACADQGHGEANREGAQGAGGLQQGVAAQPRA
jgi:hypothetical protein